MLNTVTGVPEWGLSWRSLMEWCLENLEPSGIWRWRDERQDLGENYKPWAGHGRKKHGFCQSSASDTQTIGPWNFRFGCQPMEIDLCKTNQRPHALPALCETVSVFSPSCMWVKGQSVKGSGSDWAVSAGKERAGHSDDLGSSNWWRDHLASVKIRNLSEVGEFCRSSLLCWSHHTNFGAHWVGENVCFLPDSL